MDRARLACGERSWIRSRSKTVLLWDTEHVRGNLLDRKLTDTQKDTHKVRAIADARIGPELINRLRASTPTSLPPASESTCKLRAGKSDPARSC